MKILKSLILGSAAGLVAMSAAQAADLPVKAKAVEYVRICSLYGAGFYYIPGSDTCIKLGGYAQFSVAANTNSVYTGNTSGAAGAGNRYTNGYEMRSRADLNIDTRTATEYGVVRTYMDVVFSWNDDNFASNGGGASTYGAGATANGNTGLTSYGTLGVYYAFVQFAGFTMGKAVSEFDAPFSNYPSNLFDGLVGGSGTITGVNQFTYTAQFGGGVSAAISAQDQTAYTQAGVQNVSAGGASGFGTSDYAGTYAPDIIGTVTFDQAWGVFKLSGAAHDNHTAYYGATEFTGHPEDKWGFAVQGALTIKNIPTGVGDVINLSGVYTDGATRYNIQNLAAATGAWTTYAGSNVAYQSVGIGFAPDTVFGVGTSQQLVQTYGMRGGYTHNWDPYWNTGLYGAYASVHYSSGASALICGGNVNGVAFAGSFRTTFGAGVTSCNPNYQIAQLGTITRWTPVKNLTFSADFTYEHLDQNMQGFANAGSTGIAKPGVAYELKDQNTYEVLFRAQRNW